MGDTFIGDDIGAIHTRRTIYNIVIHRLVMTETILRAVQLSHYDMNVELSNLDTKVCSAWLLACHLTFATNTGTKYCNQVMLDVCLHS